jgi:hypothetical protein
MAPHNTTVIDLATLRREIDERRLTRGVVRGLARPASIDIVLLQQSQVRPR